MSFLRLGVLLLGLLLLASCAGKEPLPVSAPKPAPTPQLAPLPAALQDWEPLIRRLQAQGFAQQWLVELFSSAEMRFDPDPMRLKLDELYKLKFNKERTQAIQLGLTDLGFAPGQADGLAGPQTRNAIRAFQKLHGLPDDGEPDEAVLQRIQAQLALPPGQRTRPPKPEVVEPGVPAKPLVYESLLTDKQLAASRAYYLEHLPLLRRMEREYGVPAALAVGIFTVETRLGEFLGGRKAVVTLASMALSKDFAVIRPHLTGLPMGAEERDWFADLAAARGDWAFNELVALLQYARANGHRPLTIPGSVYGAIGLGQFMPSNAVTYGVDGDGDGRVDLFSLRDAVASFGNFMRAMGWQGEMRDPEKQRQVLLRYNRSTRYVNTVLAVAAHVAR